MDGDEKHGETHSLIDLFSMVTLTNGLILTSYLHASFIQSHPFSIDILQRHTRTLLGGGQAGHLRLPIPSL